MAADGYIKAAHSQLTSAVSHLQSEISELQHQLSQQKSSLQSDIKQIDTKRVMHQAEITQPTQDDMQRNYLHNRLQTLDSEKGEKESQMAHMDAEINSQIQAKQQAIGSLQSQANQINGLLSLPGVR